MSDDRSLSELVKVASLKSLKHQVILRNDTSGTDIVGEGKTHIQEFRKEGIILTVPKNSCSEGHNLSLYFIRLPIEKKIARYSDGKKFKDSFEVTGKIKLVDRIEGYKEPWAITIDFIQYDVNKWRDFIISYIEKQKSLNSLKHKI